LRVRTVEKPARSVTRRGFVGSLSRSGAVEVMTYVR
jgi:hypothetical protein